MKYSMLPGTVSLLKPTPNTKFTSDDQLSRERNLSG